MSYLPCMPVLESARLLQGLRKLYTQKTSPDNRIRHVSWNRFLTSEAGFVCEDNSVRWLDVLSGLPKAIHDLSTAILKKECVESEVRCCCWANHPRLLYITEGEKAFLFPLKHIPLCKSFAKGYE